MSTGIPDLADLLGTRFGDRLDIRAGEQGAVSAAELQAATAAAVREREAQLDHLRGIEMAARVGHDMAEAGRRRDEVARQDAEAQRAAEMAREARSNIKWGSARIVN